MTTRRTDRTQTTERGHHTAREKQDIDVVVVAMPGGWKDDSDSAIAPDRHRRPPAAATHKAGADGQTATPTSATADGVITVCVPIAFRRQGGRKLLIAPDGAVTPTSTLAPPLPPAADPTLLKALGRAFRWKRMLDTGRFATMAELAAHERVSPPYLTAVMRLTLLAPELVTAILDGRQPPHITPANLIKGFPVEWERQRLAVQTDGA